MSKRIVLLALALAACSEPSGPNGGDQPPGPRPETARAGLMQITITGLSDPHPVAAVRALPGPEPASVAVPAVAAVHAAFAAPRSLSVLSGDGTVQLEPLFTASFTYGERNAGGFRYVAATYRVRNASAAGVAYGTARNNLTFLAVATSATINGTAMSTLNRFDGSGASPDIALAVLPTGAALRNVTTGVLTSAGPDVLQAYTEEEIAGFTPPGTVTSVFPYGFVVRNAANPATRELAANPAPGAFEGVVTFAFKIPLQATPAADPYTISITVLAVDDGETWITQSAEEGDATSRAAAASRATALGASARSLLGRTLEGAPVPHVCALRTAGIAASPTALLVSSAPGVSSVLPGAGLLSLSSAFVGMFCRAMSTPDASSFVVRGLQSGQAFRGMSYPASGGLTLTSPPASFFPGEEVELALSTGLQTAGGENVVYPYVRRYRVASAAASGEITATTGNVYPMSDGPRAMVTTDVNLDGRADLMVASYYSGEVTVLLGNDGGGFAPFGVPKYVGSALLGMAAGDLNGDGYPDYVTTHNIIGVPSVLGVWLSNGAGFFDYPSGLPSTVNGQPWGITLADVNHDGALDAITANSSTSDVSVLLGDGVGHFVEASGSPMAVAGSPVMVVAQDVNGDGHVDILSANPGAGTVALLLGDGTGEFSEAPESPFATGGPAQGVALSDFDGDGALDIAVANGGDGSVTAVGSLALLKGDGSGGFALFGDPQAVGQHPVVVVAGDFNADDHADVAVADFTGSSIYPYLGDGSGGLSPTGSIATPAGPWAAVAADFTGDGKPDLVTANYDDDNASVFAGDGAGGFAPYGSTVLAVGTSPVSVIPADLNSDGEPDLLVSNQGSGNVAAYLGSGGSFVEAAGSPVTTDADPNMLAVGDLDDDGYLDFVVTHYFSGIVRAYKGNGLGGFTPFGGGALDGVTNPGAPRLGDVNGDGALDILVTNNSGTIVTFLGAGDGSFATGVTSAAVPFAYWSALGDLNSDGMLDLAVAPSSGTDIAILVGDGAGHFTAAVGGPVVIPTDAAGVALGDLDADGDLDLVVVGQQIQVALGDGSGGFAAPVGYDAGFVPYGVAIADLDGDEDLDLAVSAYGDGNVVTLLGNGSGTFVPGWTTPTYGNAPGELGAVDVNDDGMMDIVVTNMGSGSITVLRNR